IALRAGEMYTIRSLLVTVGAAQGPVDDEENVVFDLKLRNERRRRRLRLRTFGGRSDAVLTSKGPANKTSAFKSRDEFEVQVHNADCARELLHQLGFRKRVAYRKRREHWQVGETIVALDRLAFGDYLEIEGGEQEIMSTLALLGLSNRPHIDAGYSRLARDRSDAVRALPTGARAG
ncbi:MAG TPA: class IV adenylate cyclase, partial [Dehalococcoidia bacterium]|nr:class IV adenylate cyclase [Dehalococcoidia bacterium]